MLADLAILKKELSTQPPEKPVSPEEAPEEHLYPCPAVLPDAQS